MEWSELLSTKKLCTDEEEPSQFADYPISEFEKDYSKIVTSAAFRRLQDKTQVFPLDKSDFIRTRLTHSLEVSTIAKQLGIMLCNNNTKYKPEDIGKKESKDIPSVLQCAGLLHDLGNPPFGHFGETVIGEWFKTNLGKLKYRNNLLKDVLKTEMQNDLIHFEGNAQTLRILSKANHHSEINLSYAIISTLIKYPTNSTSFSTTDSDIGKHKLGYFVSENSTFDQISSVVGTKNDEGIVHRHPLTFFLEAADDIAYSTADLEDAFKKKLFTLDEFIKYFNDELSTIGSISQHTKYSQELINNLKGKKDSSTDKTKIFKEWVSYTRRWLMYVVTYRFSKSYNDIMNGTYTHDLFFNTNHDITIKILKNAMNKFVFNSCGILKLELASQNILSFLLDKFVHAALFYGDEDEKENDILTKSDKKYMNIFSANYIADYCDSKCSDDRMNLYLRLMMVTDYISGMTDSYARTLYRELSGIE